MNNFAAAQPHKATAHRSKPMRTASRWHGLPRSHGL